MEGKSRIKETIPAVDSGKGEFVRSILDFYLISKDVTTTSPKLQLATLPTEVHFKIFKHLSPVSSACLGLTCKALYRIHWSLHQCVRLDRDDPDTNARLSYLLESWMAPLVLWSKGKTVKFVTVREFRHLEEVTRREKWRLEDRRASRWY
jgi:hypothetical protein